MKNSLATRLVLAAVFSLGVAGLAQAKDLQPQEYALVRVGMTQDQVKQALGQPAQARHFSLSNLTVWSYKTSDYFQRAGDRGYDVDFDADGKVIAAGVINHPDVASRR